VVKRALIALAGVLVLLAMVLAVNTFRQGSRQISLPPAPAIAVDEAGVARRLAQALTFRTLAYRDDPEASAGEFRKLHDHLRRQFPRVHAALGRETVGNFSLLYTWQGTDPRAAPLLLMAHQDVVPIAPGSDAQWHAPPFGGEIKDGYVWGRGAWDDKGNLIAQLEAVEMLLASGFQPRQTIYLCFGHDEEIGGIRGAAQVARLLQQRGVRLGFVLDEGLFITEGMMPGLTRPAAVIGVAEKGFVSVLLKASGTPGHSSIPPAAGQSAIGLLSAVLRRLDTEPLPARLAGVAQEMFETIAPEMSGLGRLTLSNLWLFAPLVQAQLERGATTNALVRTTTALTILKAGNADNVLPGMAEGVANFRIVPGETVASVLRHVRDKAADARVEVAPLPGASEPSAVSATASAPYRLIQRTMRTLFPDVIVTPGLMIAATDSRHFAGISDQIFRFSPVRANSEDVARFHGTDERMAVSNLAEMVRFYHELLRNASASSP